MQANWRTSETGHWHCSSAWQRPRILPLPDREDVLGADNGILDPGERLYTLASRIPIGPADRYAVLAAPTAAERLTALSEAVDSVAAVIEFHLSE